MKATRRTWARALVGALALSLVAAACGGDDSDDSSAADTETTTEDTAAGASEDAESEDSESAAGMEVNLADVCPDPVVIQTDWHAESEHGALYEMVGDGYQADKPNATVTGPLVSGGQETGIQIEIREGGPATGFTDPDAEMYKDDSIHLAYVSTDVGAANHAELPTIAVVAPLEKNPQIIMWDPETYPDVESIADLGEQNVTVRYFPGAVYIEHLVKTGVLSEDQLDDSYDGTPAVFISEGGTIAQQGFASAEPYTYEVELAEEWGKPVDFELIHDVGLQSYSQSLAVRADRLEELRPCLEQLVPVIQQAQVDFVEDPTETNQLILDLVATYDNGWVYSEGIAEYSVETQKELGLVSNGPDDTLGNMDPDRVQSVIDGLAILDGFEEVAELTPEDIMTNEFIDSSIGL